MFFDFSSPLAAIFTCIAISVIPALLAAEWFIFLKAGEKGWKALIPFYSTFLSHHIIGMSHAWFIIDMVLWVCEMFIEEYNLGTHLFSHIFFAFTAVFTIVSEIIHINKLCNVFRKGRGFKIGTFCVPEVFLLIIAFSKAEYHKPEHK